MLIINIKTTLGKVIETSKYTTEELAKIKKFYSNHKDFAIITRH